MKQPSEPAHLIDADIARGDAILFERRKFGIVGMGTGIDQVANPMIVGHGQPLPLDLWPGGVGEQAQRQRARKAALADAAWAAQYPAMMHPPAGGRADQQTGLRVMANQ